MAQPPPPEASGQRAGQGIILAMFSATSLGVVTSFARLAYDNGSTPFAFIAWRYVASLALALVIVRALGRSLRVPRPAWAPVCAVTAGMAMISIGYLSSVRFIPVGLAALLFYSYPMLVLAISAVAARTVPGPMRILAFVLAFTGLALALTPSLNGLDWRGVAFALTASMGATVLFVMTPKATRYLSVYSLTVWTSLAGLPIALLVLPMLGDYAVPQFERGWIGFVLAIAFYIAGQLSNFAALRLTEPSRAALVYNLEPLVAITAAAVILGETMLPMQYAGGALVIAALFLASRPSRPAARA